MGSSAWVCVGPPFEASGAACFALYGSQEDADRAAGAVEPARVGRVYRFHTLTDWPGID